MTGNDVRNARKLQAGLENCRRPDQPVVVRIDTVVKALGRDHPVSKTLSAMHGEYEKRRSEIEQDDELTERQRVKAIRKLTVTPKDAGADEDCPVCGKAALRSRKWVALPVVPLRDAIKKAAAEPVAANNPQTVNTEKPKK